MAFYRVNDSALEIAPTAYVDLRSGVEVTVINLMPEFVTKQLIGKAESGDFQRIDIGSTSIITLTVDYSGKKYQSVQTYEGLLSNNPRYVSGVAKIGNQVVSEFTGASVSVTSMLSAGGSIDSILSGNDAIFGTRNSDFLWGYAGNDSLFGGAGNDFLNGMSGVDSIDGGAGIDTLIVDNTSENRYQKSSDALWIIDTDAITNVERVRFWDKSIALDVDRVAGQAYRIYKAAFNRTPDTAGLGYWIAQMDKGTNTVEVAARFIDSPEFRLLYGQNPSNTTFLTKVYTNVLGRTPDQGGYNWWLNELNTNPSKTKAKVLADFAESSENQAGVASLIGNGITYEPWVG